jgi:hypothetical protein
VGIVPKYLQADPLDGVKNDQDQSKANKEKSGKEIGKQFGKCHFWMFSFW